MHAHVSICVRLFLGDILDTALSNLESFSLLKAHSWYHFPLLLFKNCIYFFYWRKIALQNFFVLCQTSTWISYRYTCIPSLLKLHPIFVPTSPLQVDTGPLIEFSEPFSKFLLAMYFTYGNVSFHATLSTHVILSPLPMSISLLSMSFSPLVPYK